MENIVSLMVFSFSIGVIAGYGLAVWWLKRRD